MIGELQWVQGNWGDKCETSAGCVTLNNQKCW